MNKSADLYILTDDLCFFSFDIFENPFFGHFWYQSQGFNLLVSVLSGNLPVTLILDEEF
jgi:hypothetical protein